MIDAKEKLGDAMTALSALRDDDAGKNEMDDIDDNYVTPSIEMEDDEMEEEEEKEEEEEEDKDKDYLITTSESCLDNPGYYLNHRGRAVQCSWLMDGRDPTNESRRIHNCGYTDTGGGENNDQQQQILVLLPEATDLGKMCKNTCVTCGQ